MVGERDVGLIIIVMFVDWFVISIYLLLLLGFWYLIHY